ncbi:MAG: GTPase ObgE [Bacteroidales bacterium]
MATSNFVDYVKIYFRSGNGGAGSAHLLHTRTNYKGGPDGGDGGRGGHIILAGNEQHWTLLHLKYRKHISAEPGEPGNSANKKGADGNDVIVEVPIGTIAKDAETGEILCEITSHDEKQILIKGGRGGLGNTQFKSATNQTPRYAQPGEPGSEGWIILELKILADVGLVGFPNAGKSSLLAVVSAAKPKIADYPFTTLVPNLGIVSYREGKSFVMADIPGIIEGASEGKGLGLRFLRHIERNSVLLFIITADADSVKKQYEILLQELEQYNPELLDKKRILGISKSDLIDDEIKQEIEKNLPEITYVFFSSLTNNNIDKLKDIIWKQIHL